jgi:hypothetical protein
MREIFVETGGRKTTAGGENSGESRKGAEGARLKMPNLSGKRTETYRRHDHLLSFSFSIQSFRIFRGSLFYLGGKGKCKR